jgi:xanthine dehydrogenase accessory factor
MSSDDVFFGNLAEELSQRGRLALASVTECRGSGPSRVGRRFLVFEDGSFSGTIGGGPFEALVIADAAALFREEGPERLLKWYDFFEREIISDMPREPTNMICGGSARVSIELLRAAPALVIFGGGHVGLALARLAVTMGYAVFVGDDREAYARPDRFPKEATVFRANRDYGIPPGILPSGRDLYVAVVTRCWETDLAALRPWLTPDSPKARYLGLIGSARKVRGVFARLREEGVPEEPIGRVHGPMGLAIGAITPEEIAVSIMAEVTAARRHVAREGASEPMRVETR